MAAGKHDLSGIRNAEEFRRHVIATGGRCTDGPVAVDFQAGWAKHPFVAGMLTHWWVRGDALTEQGAYKVLSACGLQRSVNARVPLLLPGNYDPCARCDSRMLRR